jgi:hypothetical protein
MAKNYNQHVAELREKIASEGLSCALREALSAIPAAIGHLLDTLLKLDGLILADRENYLSGPFGFLLGISFVIIGALVGKLADILLKVPSHLGYYVFDNIINYFSPGFQKVMLQEDVAEEVSGTKLLLIRTYFSFTYLTHPPPKEMSGLFGFLLGVIPQTINYIVQRVSATLTALVHYPITRSCAAIRDFYGSKSTPADYTYHKLPKKQCRVKRLNESDTDDLFAALEIDRENYTETNAPTNVDQAFKKLSKRYHPDHYQQESEDIKLKMSKKIALILKARDVLGDPNSDKARRYLSIYDSTHVFCSGAGTTNTRPDIEDNTKDDHARDHRIKRPE